MKPKSNTKPIQLLELFGGIGSPRCALRNLGIPTKAIDYVEIDEKAVRSYNAMFEKELPHKTQSVVGWDLKPNVLIHGSPCQDFSIAGHQKGADDGSETRSSLMWETIKIIEHMGDWKPMWVIWENVKNVRSKHMVVNHNRYLKEMSKLGYTNSFDILDARDFGLPQARQRVITISHLDGKTFDFKKLVKQPMKPLFDFLESPLEEKYIVSQPSMLNKINSKNSFGGGLKIVKDYVMTITCKQVRCPNSGIIEIGKGEYRYLTELECWRLQGYTDEDYYAAEKANPCKDGKLNAALYKQAGNSIPVSWFEAIFGYIFLGRKNEDDNQLSMFDD